MSPASAKDEDELLDAIHEDEVAAIIEKLRASGQADYARSWLSLA